MQKKQPQKCSAELKAQAALAAISGQMTVQEIMKKYGVSKTAVYTWKTELQSKASTLFGGSQPSDEGLNPGEVQKKMDNLHRKIGELEMELDFAKRASVSLGIEMPPKRLISSEERLSISRQLEILGISKGHYYYEPKGPTQEEIEICHKIDEHHEIHPAKGVRQMRLFLPGLGLVIGVKKVRRLMRVKTSRPNHVWSTDITYVRMPHGHAYLYAIIDVYSRYIVAWGLYTTLDGANAIEVLERAIETHGKPEIINSDQGSQYTCKAWVERLKSEGIQISMDGLARCLFIPIHRWPRCAAA